MAYTFDQINSVLGQQAAGNAGGTDIFGQGDGANAAQQGQSDQSQAGSSEAPKTSTEGELSAGSAGSSGAQAQPKQTSAQTSGQAILDKAKKADLDTGFTNKLVGDVKQGESTLQNEANAYTAAQSGKSAQNLGASDIEAGLNGDTGKRSAVENLLRGPGASADQFQSGVTNQFQDIDQVGTQGGLQAYLKKRGNENYSEGDAALDSLLFSRDKNFQSGVQAAKQERDKLNQQKQNYESTLQNQAQQGLDTAQNAAKTDTSNYLAAQKAKFQQDTAARIAAENTRRQGIENNAGTQANEDAWGVFEPLKGQMAPDLSYLEQARKDIDPNAYAHHQYHAADAGDVLNSGEASRFNNIQQLLGQGGDLAVNNTGPYQGYSYDKDAYKNALLAQVAKLKGNAPKAQVSASGGVKQSGGGFNPFNAITTPYAAVSHKEDTSNAGSRASGLAKKIFGG